ncbi:MAG: signal peptidase [Actinomycetota bacterium]|jgi:signal peptidase II
MTLSRRVALIIGVVVGIDQWTKHWAVSSLDDGRTVDIFWTLRFALGFNSGFAFSQGQGMGPIIGVVAVVAFVWLVRAALKAPNAVMSTAYALIAAGAIGNVVDRLFREDKWMNGRVVDFIDFQWFPVFNVADSSITIGAALLVLALLRDSKTKEGAGVK